MLTSEQQLLFKTQGIVKLPSAVPKKQTESAKRFIIAELERLKLKTGGKLSAPKIESLPHFQQTTRLGQLIPTGPWLERLFAPELLASMRSIGGLSSRAEKPQVQLLLSLPHKAAWSLGGLNWHVDQTPPRKDVVSGVQAFVLIDDLRARGGGTLALAGSHRLHYIPEAREDGAQRLLRRDPVLCELFNPAGIDADALFQQRDLCGVPISIVEMCGKAGDVFLMDMRVLHSPSINASKAIRMMATARLISPTP